MKRLAIATLCIGEFYEKLARSSHETIQAYADKCDADFIVKREASAGRQVIGYEKLTLLRELLATYERVLWIDSDVLVRHDAPNLFDVVPEDALAAYDEGDLYPERKKAKQLFLEHTKADAPGWLATRRYFNTGVLMVSRIHAPLFAEPAAEVDNFAEQTLLNFRMHFYNVKLFPLPHRFNRLLGTLLKSGEPLDDSFLVHFAGAFIGPAGEPNFEAFIACANRFKKYRAENSMPVFRKRIYIEMAGALGDVVATEPVVRYIRRVLEPDADITVKTEFPPVLAHLAADAHTTILGPGETATDKGHLRLPLFPEPPIANFNMMPAVDYAALAAFRGQLPREHRHIELAVNAEPAIQTDDFVLVHPGRSWQSKTFPRDWWQAVIDGISDHLPVALIGKTYPGDDFRGTVDVTPGRRCLDLRNKTTLPQLIAMISRARVLVSNDSSPVHIAGAFTTPVVMITSAKHPDFIWPQRDPSLNITLGRPIAAAQAAVGIVNAVFMHECSPEELLSVLPEPGEVVAATVQAYEREADHYGSRKTRRKNPPSEMVTT